MCLCVPQHPCSHRGCGLPRADGGPPAPLQTPPDENQPAAALGGAALPCRHVSLRIHRGGLHRRSCGAEFDHVHLEPQPHHSHGEDALMLSCPSGSIASFCVKLSLLLKCLF